MREGIDHHHPVVGLVEHVELPAIPRQGHGAQEAVGHPAFIGRDRRSPALLDQIEEEDRSLIATRGIEGPVVRRNRQPHEDGTELVVIVIGYFRAPIPLPVGRELRQLRIFSTSEPANDRDGKRLRPIAGGDEGLSIWAQRQAIRVRGDPHVPAPRRQHSAVGKDRTLGKIDRHPVSRRCSQRPERDRPCACPGKYQDSQWQ